MFYLRNLGNSVYLDETKGDGSENGGGPEDRGDEFEELEGQESEDKDKDTDDSDDDGSEEEGEGKKSKKADEKKAGEKDEKDSQKSAKMVPHARMKEAVEKERKAREETQRKLDEAEEKVKEVTRGVDTAKLNEEIEDLEDRLDKAIADNNPDQKKLLRKELREKMQTLARAEAAALSAQATALAVERVRYDAFVERLETQHPQMNPDHDDYDEGLVADIVEMKEAYEAKGMSSTEALRKAAKYILRDGEKSVEKNEEEGDEDKSDEAKKAEEKRREEAVKRSQDAKKKQPASADKSGRSSDKSGGGRLDVTKMSDAEFDKMSEDDKARLRGD